MTGAIGDDVSDIDLSDIEKKDLICTHGSVAFGYIDEKGHPEGSCDSTDIDLEWKDKGVIIATCKKCGSQYKLSPYMWAAERIKPKKVRRTK